MALTLRPVKTFRRNVSSTAAGRGIASSAQWQGNSIELPSPKLEATQMNAQLDQRPIAPAIWIVVDEEDWSGVNDCGAIHLFDNLIDLHSPLADEIDWPIESCS
jgi:hypothetical protein